VRPSIYLETALSLQVVDPWVDGGASPLARRPLPLVRSELELALGLPPSASRRSVLEVAAEEAGAVDGVQGFREASVVDELLAGDEVDVRKGQDGVDELEEPLDAVGPVVEPGRVEEEGEGGLALGVVVQKVLRENLLDGIGLLGVETSVSHGATSTAHVQQGGHGDLPHAGVASGGAGLDGARVRDLVVECIRPAGAADGHAGVVVEAVPSEHAEHGVAADGQEGCPHALDVLGVDAGVADQHLGLADHLVGPLLLVEVGAVAVRHRVGGDLVAVRVQVLHLRVVRPLMGNVKRRLDWATVGVDSVVEEFLEELFVETVDGVVEGEEDELRNALLGQVSGNVGAAAVAVGDAANVGIARTRLLLSVDQSSNQCHQHEEGGQRGRPTEPHL